MARNGPKMAIYQLLFWGGLAKLAGGLRQKSETVTFKPIKPQNDCLNLSFVKDEHTYGKKWPEMVVQRSYIKGHSFPYRLYVLQQMKI